MTPETRRDLELYTAGVAGYLMAAGAVYLIGETWSWGIAGIVLLAAGMAPFLLLMRARVAAWEDERAEARREQRTAHLPTVTPTPITQVHSGQSVSLPGPPTFPAGGA